MLFWANKPRNAVAIVRTRMITPIDHGRTRGDL